MNKPRNFYKDTFHHIYNRGANKEKIFFDKNDYIYFLKKLREYKQELRINILCYCLMPNHFHIFAEQTSDQFPLSGFISSLTNSYTKSINKKYKRSGVLFEGRTKSKHCEDESYFRWIFKYILSNHVKDGLVEHVTDWDFSNARDLFGLRDDDLCENHKVFEYFDSKKQFIEFIEDDKYKLTYDVW